MNKTTNTLILGTLMSAAAVSANAQDTQNNTDKPVDFTKSGYKILNSVRGQKYTSQKLSEDGKVFMGVHPDGTEETRVSFLSSNHGQITVRRIGKTTEVASKNFKITSTTSGYKDNFHKIEYSCKQGTKAYSRYGNDKFSLCPFDVNDFASVDEAINFNFNPQQAADLVKAASKIHDNCLNFAVNNGKMRDLVDLTSANNQDQSLQLTPDMFNSGR